MQTIFYDVIYFIHVYMNYVTLRNITKRDFPSHEIIFKCGRNNHNGQWTFLNNYIVMAFSTVYTIITFRKIFKKFFSNSYLSQIFMYAPWL